MLRKIVVAYILLSAFVPLLGADWSIISPKADGTTQYKDTSGIYTNGEGVNSWSAEIRVHKKGNDFTEWIHDPDEPVITEVWEKADGWPGFVLKTRLSG